MFFLFFFFVNIYNTKNYFIFRLFIYFHSCFVHFRRREVRDLWNQNLSEQEFISILFNKIKYISQFWDIYLSFFQQFCWNFYHTILLALRSLSKTRNARLVKQNLRSQENFILLTFLSYHLFFICALSTFEDEKFQICETSTLRGFKKNRNSIIVFASFFIIIEKWSETKALFTMSVSKTIKKNKAKLRHYSPWALSFWWTKDIGAIISIEKWIKNKALLTMSARKPKKLRSY